MNENSPPEAGGSRRGPGATRFERGGLAVLLLVPLLATVLDTLSPPKVIKDEVQHLAYLRSLVLDRDLDFSDDFQLLWPKFRKHPWRVAATGRPPNTAALGAPLVWMPGYALVHAAMHLSGASEDANGASGPYRAACVLTSSALFSLGVALSYRLARQRFGWAPAALGSLLVAGASFLGYWWLFPGLYAHAPAIGLTTLFVFVWLRGQGRVDARRWVILGALGGFLTLVRWQNVWLPFTCGAVELCWLLAGDRSASPGHPIGMGPDSAKIPASVSFSWRLRGVLVCGVVYALATFAALSPQLLSWKAIYGSYLPQTGGSTFLQWLKPYWLDLLFSPRYGLLGFSPWLYVPVAGLGIVAWRGRREPLWIVAALYLVASVYLNSCLASVSWYGGATFGPRRLDSLFPFLVLGGAYAADRLMRWFQRSPAVPLAVASGLGVLWTFTMASAYRSEDINVGMVGAEGFAWRAPNAFVDRLGWPPSWPAELYYGLHDGLRWGQYTALAGADPVPFGDGRIDLTRADRRHLGAGWVLRDPSMSSNGKSGKVVSMESSDRDANLFLYVMDKGLRENDLSLLARFARGTPSRVRLNGHRLEQSPSTTPDGETVIRMSAPSELWRPGVNRLGFGPATAGSVPLELASLTIERVGEASAGD